MSNFFDLPEEISKEEFLEELNKPEQEVEGDEPEEIKPKRQLSPLELLLGLKLS